MILAVYLASLVGAIVLGITLGGSVPLLLAFSFAAWVGGWTANDLRSRRSQL